MDEIKDVIAGLIQNYEVIRDSEVMMSKEANSIGKCPLCGSAVEDKAKAFFCSNRACKFALWKNNRYFASIGKSMTSATAQKLLGSGKVKLKNCKSERTATPLMPPSLWRYQMMAKRSSVWNLKMEESANDK